LGELRIHDLRDADAFTLRFGPVFRAFFEDKNRPIDDAQGRWPRSCGG
jgi:hypothetical protein